MILIRLLIYLSLNIIRIIVLILFLLVGIAYLTILERKILRCTQFRKDSNKVGFLGLLQSFRDGFKLLVKVKRGVIYFIRLII